MKSIFKKLAVCTLTLSMSLQIMTTVSAQVQEKETYAWNTATTEISSPIKGKYSMGSAVAVGDNTQINLAYLYDGDYSTRVAAALTNPTLGERVENHYFEIDFGAEYKIDDIQLGYNVNNNYALRPARFYIDRFDPETNAWVQVGGMADPVWGYEDKSAEVKNKMVYSTKAKLSLGEFSASAVRIYPCYLQGANKSGFYLIDELVAYGKQVEGTEYQPDSEDYDFKEKNPENGMISADYSAGFAENADALKDGKYTTGITGTYENGTYDEEKDYINASFTDRLFKVNSIRLGVSRDEENIAARVRVLYMNENGEWQEDREYDLTYEDRNAEIKKKKIAEINLANPIEAREIRVIITQTANGSSEYNVSEFVVLGEYKKMCGFFELESCYILGFELERWSTAVESLGDGKYTDGVACNGVDYVNGVYGDEYHILMHFGGKIAVVKSLKLACNENNFADQAVTSIRVDYLDPNTGTYTRGSAYTLLYDDVPNGKCAEIILDAPIRTNIVRVQILTSNRRYRLFKISELKAFGEMTNEYGANPLSSAVITSGGDTADKIADGDFTTAYEGQATEISEDKPYAVDIDFGAEKYITGFEIMSSNADSCGIKNMTVRYEAGGKWYPASRHTFEYDAKRATDGFAIVKGETEVLANRIRIEITGVNSDEGKFKINELRFTQADFGALSGYEQALKRFQLKKTYSYYTDCIEAADSVPADKKDYFMDKVNSCKEELEENQVLNVTYDVSNEQAILDGYVFSPAGTKTVIFTAESGETITAEAQVDENGTVFAAVYFGDRNIGGELASKIVIENGSEIPGNSITVRTAETGCNIERMSIDGRSVVFSGTTGSVTLPAGSSLNDRIPVFTLSSGAKLYYGAEEVISAVTKLNLTASSIFTVRAEKAGIEKIYTIAVKTEPSMPIGGGGGGSSGNRGGGFAAVTPADAAFAQTDTFRDVPSGFWGYESIMKLYNKGIVKGVAKDEFEPQKHITRAEFLKMLLGVMGVDARDAETGFADTEGHWCEGYIAAGVQLGIVSGTSRDTFSPDATIKRQDAAVMIDNALGYDKVDFTANFSDDQMIADYAKEAVYTLKSRGIISGYDNAFRPADSMTRAEAASIFAGLVN